MAGVFLSDPKSKEPGASKQNNGKVWICFSPKLDEAHFSAHRRQQQQGRIELDNSTFWMC